MCTSLSSPNLQIWGLTCPDSLHARKARGVARLTRKTGAEETKIYNMAVSWRRGHLVSFALQEGMLIIWLYCLMVQVVLQSVFAGLQMTILQCMIMAQLWTDLMRMGLFVYCTGTRKKREGEGKGEWDEIREEFFAVRCCDLHHVGVLLLLIFCFASITSAHPPPSPVSFPWLTQCFL